MAFVCDAAQAEEANRNDMEMEILSLNETNDGI
jgi:hypothetical protein